jgi:hypothetical protein
VMAVCVAMAAVWVNVIAVRGGLYESDEGIVLKLLFRSEGYRWDDVDQFEHRLIGTHDYVYVGLVDGSRRRVINMLQGLCVIWDGGETKDIVAVLSERLADRRAAICSPVRMWWWHRWVHRCGTPNISMIAAQVSLPPMGAAANPCSRLRSICVRSIRQRY